MVLPGNHDRLKGDFAAPRKQLAGRTGLCGFSSVQTLAVDTDNAARGKSVDLNATATVDPARTVIVGAPAAPAWPGP
ncbi:MAG: hypothetical protein PHC30_02400 [Lentisphaeria bacterium]|nr:hypothetical protein [Lentisphaeria bacterium]